jgi:hypothetical protein
MDALTTQVMQILSQQDVSRISRKIGADEQKTAAALSAVAPLLVTALANNASRPRGAQSLRQALVEDHDGSILGNLPAFLENPEAANGAGIMKHVLGRKQATVKRGLAGGTGLTSSQIGALLKIVAPLVMGALGQHQQQQGFDVGGLSSFLGQQQQTAQQSSPDMMGMIGSLLDANKDGSALDDVVGMMGKLFGGR